MLPSLSSSATQLAHILFVIYSLVPIAHGAITDVFHVKGGTTKGGCDAKNIVGWFADVERLIDSAETGAAATDQDSRKYLQTFFSIGPNDNADQAGGPIHEVKLVINGDNPPPGGKPWLFCGSDWLEELKLTDVAYDPETGQKFTDGTKVQDIFTVVPNQSLFWSDDLQQYLQADPGDYCSEKAHLAATQDQTRPSTVTLCIDNFPSNQGDTLAAIPAVSAEKESVSALQVHSLTLFHEMFHLSLGTQNTPDAGYNLNSIVRYGTKKAVTNPESFTFYALAYYLGQNTPYTFAASKSAKKPTLPRRRHIYDSSDSGSKRNFLVAFQPVKRDLAENSWVA